ncbi:MAG: DUF4215 domain-containing protein [Myxococcota bacterium]
MSELVRGAIGAAWDVRLARWFVLGSLGLSLAACGQSPRCGDGVLDQGEVCDDGNTAAGDGCRADCLGLEVCGDGLVDACEECDDGAESVACDVDCTTVACGDGMLNRAAGEECPGDSSDDVGCFVDCPCPYCCGNGRIDPGEACDDGGESALCDSDCTIAECGDAHANASAGEECDWGLNAALCGAISRDGGNRDDSPDTCREDCRLPYCGDGVVDTGVLSDGAMSAEACDDGGLDTETCDSDCTAPVCGDGYLNRAAGELCDSNGANSPDCDSDCTAVQCGDGHLNRAAGEECESHADCPPSLTCTMTRETAPCTCTL